MTRPTLDEMYYDPMKARPTRLQRQLGYDLIAPALVLQSNAMRKMPKNLGHIESLARSYTDTAIKTLAGIMMEPNCPPMARVAAAKVLLDRGWGKPKEMHHSEVDDSKTLLKVVNEIAHVYETREQIEFNDQTPLLEINPSKNGGPRPSLPSYCPSPSPSLGSNYVGAAPRSPDLLPIPRGRARLHICSIVNGLARSER